jgi:UDP-glucose 4-epimerase
MARRPFHPAAHGLRKAEYRQGDVLDPDAVAALVDEADVVVHLAFIIIGGGEEARRVNLEGSRAVFDAAAQAGVRRLVYTSSVAAYGFHPDNPTPLTEDVPARGTDDHPYSRFTCPSLTTVAQDYDSISAKSVEALLAMIAEGRPERGRVETLFEGKLIMRASA